MKWFVATICVVFTLDLILAVFCLAGIHCGQADRNIERTVSIMCDLAVTLWGIWLLSRAALKGDK